MNPFYRVSATAIHEAAHVTAALALDCFRVHGATTVPRGRHAGRTWWAEVSPQSPRERIAAAIVLAAGPVGEARWGEGGSILPGAGDDVKAIGRLLAFRGSAELVGSGARHVGAAAQRILEKHEAAVSAIATALHNLDELPGDYLRMVFRDAAPADGARFAAAELERLLWMAPTSPVRRVSAARDGAGVQRGAVTAGDHFTRLRELKARGEIHYAVLERQPMPAHAGQEGR